MAKAKVKTIFTCQKCGAQRPKWQGHCSDCGAWNTYVEETFSTEGSVASRGWSIAETGPSSSTQPHGGRRTVKLNEPLENDEVIRKKTGIGELDRVLGNGLVPGSFTLIGGDPGIGKSTLIMQMAGGLASRNFKVLYVSGEESVTQTGLRAQRLGVKSGNVEVMSESNLDTILEVAKSKEPDLLVVDSIQTVFLPNLNSAPGTVSQVRESAGHLMMLAKGSGISVFLIGHVTKEGSIAGPKVLEHMVDTVLSFEGDMSHQFRLLRSLKNRFGATNELGVFQMHSGGLREVANPSELFLEERGENLVGSAVFASMEGSRPLLCEVQSLTVFTPMPMPRRTAIGCDVNRLQLLVAVLDKHLNLQLGQTDIFLNVVGGLRVTEPASDLALAAAILSSHRNAELDPKACYFGEIGLTGEVRAVSFAELRLKEAHKLGFKKFYVPTSNRKHLDEISVEIQKGIIWVKNIKDLSRTVSSKSPERSPVPKQRANEIS